MIRVVDIVHHTHTDLGYTDHPAVCETLHVRHLTEALECAEATRELPEGERFTWTVEVLEVFRRWWHWAGGAERDRMLAAVDRGQIEVMGFPFHATAFLDEREWDRAFRWIPQELWARLGIECGMQTDVNGVPRAAVMRAVSRGIRYLWVGPNSYLGRPPFDAPALWEWEMPTGPGMMVYLNPGYCNGYHLLYDSWRRGPVPGASDTRYRRPGPRDVFVATEEGVRGAHERLCRNLSTDPSTQDAQGVENTRFSGLGPYPYSSLPVSVTNQWRIDNDPPIPHLPRFVGLWNSLGLEPTLRLTTPRRALERLFAEAGEDTPRHRGEWVDWWARGSLSAPRDLAASRKAKRLLASLDSPVLAPGGAAEEEVKERVLRDLCLFEEHTWGSWLSAAEPYSSHTEGQTCEKSAFAHRALAESQLMVSDSIPLGDGEGEPHLLVVHAGGEPTSDWIELPAASLRGDFRSVRDEAAGTLQPLERLPGQELFVRPRNRATLGSRNTARTFMDHSPERTLRFWSGTLAPHSSRRFTLRRDPVADEPQAACGGPVLATDDSGWPISIGWPGMKDSLIGPGFGDPLVLALEGWCPRWHVRDVFDGPTAAQRLEERGRHMREEPCTPEGTISNTNSPHTIEVIQNLAHPSFGWISREMRIWREEARIRLTLRLHRLSSFDPEVYYLSLFLGGGQGRCLTSLGGVPYRPGAEQLPGTCLDYFTTDGWLTVTGSSGTRLLSGRDTQVFAAGEPGFVERREAPDERTDRVYAMLFDNTWDTNFPLNSHGEMAFAFTLCYSPDPLSAEDAGRKAESADLDPILRVQT